jgi:hypothetical protein
MCIDRDSKSLTSLLAISEKIRRADLERKRKVELHGQYSSHLPLSDVSTDVSSHKKPVMKEGAVIGHGVNAPIKEEDIEMKLVEEKTEPPVVPLSTDGAVKEGFDSHHPHLVEEPVVPMRRVSLTSVLVISQPGLVDEEKKERIHEGLSAPHVQSQDTIDVPVSRRLSYTTAAILPNVLPITMPPSKTDEVGEVQRESLVMDASF